ncbi:hypothetical protein STCU_11964 [Strigomonas culicis]|uniref:Uncharacterized protein n=1 Tax=Strigomonas culicis TaxID=28005 RepID=S9TGP2_9TRYP|nr:hypothetical protein STCU_11964 [Strigomonas culicis]|eukprot:EPY15513.1 hypothetical protein STCU_11964 [Strigomonas culicis]
MLPYGTLWELDEKLHPPAPRVPPTVSRRRGRALFFFFFVAVVLSLFMIPYYFARLRRLQTDLNRTGKTEHLFYGSEMEHTHVVETQQRALEALLHRIASTASQAAPAGEAVDSSVARLWQEALYDTAATPQARHHFYFSADCTSPFAGAAHHLYAQEQDRRPGGLSGTLVVQLDEAEQQFQRVSAADAGPSHRPAAANATPLSTTAQPQERHCQLAFWTSAQGLPSRLQSLSTVLRDAEAGGSASAAPQQTGSDASRRNLHHRIAPSFRFSRRRGASGGGPPRGAHRLRRPVRHHRGDAAGPAPPGRAGGALPLSVPV